MRRNNLKTAIIHEWLVNYSGSERCVESFNNIWPESDIFALVDFLTEEERSLILKGKKTRTSFIQNLPFAKKHFRNYLPLFPLAVEQFDVSGYDVIISSSHAVAKGVLTNSSQLHICYCHTPMRYAWDMYHQYLKENNASEGIKGLILKLVLHRLRIWDFSSSVRPDYFIANSEYVKKRIKRIYNRESEVIYPPVDVNNFYVGNKRENYYIVVSRLVPYKKINLIVEAFNKMPDKKLIVAGDGPMENYLKSIAGKNIEILGYRTNNQIRDLLSKAKAFVFAAEEDFGIVIVEALASGTPVIAFGKGGATETVIPMVNGILYNEQTPDSITSGIREFEKNSDNFDHNKIKESAEKFSREIFETKIKNFILSKHEKR